MASTSPFQRSTRSKKSVSLAASAAIALATFGLVPPLIPAFVVSSGALGFCLAGTTGLL
jgi:hypothetical protein